MTTKTNTYTSHEPGRRLTNDEIKQRYAAIMDGDTQFGCVGDTFLMLLNLAAASAMLGILVYAMFFM